MLVNCWMEIKLIMSPILVGNVGCNTNCVEESLSVTTVEMPLTSSVKTVPQRRQL